MTGIYSQPIQYPTQPENAMRDPDDTLTGDLFPHQSALEPVQPQQPGRCFLCWGERPCMEPEIYPAEYRS